MEKDDIDLVRYLLYIGDNTDDIYNEVLQWATEREYLDLVVYIAEKML